MLQRIAIIAEHGAVAVEHHNVETFVDIFRHVMAYEAIAKLVHLYIVFYA
jgi:hypothetical protein